MGNNESFNTLKYSDLSPSEQTNLKEIIKQTASNHYQIRFAYFPNNQIKYRCFWQTQRKYLWFSNLEEILNVINSLNQPYIIHEWFGRYQEYLDICFIQFPNNIKDKDKTI
jgi:hypothetical protein